MGKDLARRRALNDKFAGKDAYGKTGKPISRSTKIDSSRATQEKLMHSLGESSKAYKLVNKILNKAKGKTRQANAK